MLRTAMSPTLHLPRGADTYGAALEGLVRLNQAIMKRVGLPPLLRSGVIYKPDPQELWKRADEVLSDGYGDCEDLAAYLAAEMRHRMIDPEARAIVYQSRPHVWHAIVQRSNGITIDPSKILLARERKGVTMRDYIGADPTPRAIEITITAERTASGGYKATIRIPLDDARALFMERSGPTETAAKQTAAQSAVKRIMDNPMLRAALPGPVAAALPILADPKAQEVAAKAIKGIGGGAAKVFGKLF